MYEVGGEVVSEAGPIELTFTDNGLVLLDGGADGESLRIERSQWVDHFSEPLSVENRDYIAKSGKWTSFDVSKRTPYIGLVGERVRAINPVESPDRKVTGLIISTDHCVLRVENVADEIQVDIAEKGLPYAQPHGEVDAVESSHALPVEWCDGGRSGYAANVESVVTNNGWVEARLGGTVCPATTAPVSSNVITPLQSKFQPCSGCAAITTAVSRSAAVADGHGGR